MIHCNQGVPEGYCAMSYIISNPHSRTIWSSKGFRIHRHRAEKTTRFLFRGTFGHTVGCENAACKQFEAQVVSRTKTHQICSSDFVADFLCACTPSFPLVLPSHVITTLSLCPIWSPRPLPRMLSPLGHVTRPIVFPAHRSRRCCFCPPHFWMDAIGLLLSA